MPKLPYIDRIWRARGSIELIPPRTLPRTSSGKLSRSKARAQYLAGEIQPFALAA